MTATTAMIVSCPSCATTYELPPGETPADGTVIRCSACGHSWLEGQARTKDGTRHEAAGKGKGERLEARPLNARVPATTGGDDADQESPGHDAQSEQEDGPLRFGLDTEAELLARQAMVAEAERRRRTQARRRERRRWAALAIFLVLVAGGVHLARHALVNTFPGLARLYAALGEEIDVSGFQVVRLTAERTTTLGGDRLIAVTGQLRNTSGEARPAPRLRFVLRDAQGGALHAWELKPAGHRQAEAGRLVRFVTRLADPPAEAVRVEVHFVSRARNG